MQFQHHQTYNTEHPLACPRVRMQMANRGNVVLYLDKDLVEQSKGLGFNLSRTFENHLKQLIAQLSNNQVLQKGQHLENRSSWWAGPDLPPTGSEPKT